MREKYVFFLLFFRFMSALTLLHHIFIFFTFGFVFVFVFVFLAVR